MDDGAALTDFEAQVATEPLRPAEFLLRVKQLLGVGQTTAEGAEALRLAYLVNPLNTDADREEVRALHLTVLPAPPNAEAGQGSESPGGGGGPGPRQVASPRARRGATSRPLQGSLPTPASADGGSDAQAGAEVQDALGTWRLAQAAFQKSEWEQARRLTQALVDLPEYERPARDLLHSIDRHEDFVLPELQGLAAGLSSALRREAWEDVDQIWERAQAIIAEQQSLGAPTRVPPTLVEQYTRAKHAQQAQPMVKMAVELRKQGKFIESDSLLSEAVKLDPDNGVILPERERCSLGMARLASVESLLGRGQVPFAELIEAVDAAATLEYLAPESESLREAARTLRRVKDETVERLTQRAGQLLDEIERRAGLGEKWSLCGEASRRIDDLFRLAPERSELALLQERFDLVSGQITRAQDLSDGLTAALENVGKGETLSPIQVGRLAADLKEAQAVAPEDLNLRSLEARIAEAISLSLSSPDYLLRGAEEFDLASLYNARELLRLLAECPGSPGVRTVEGYRHALVAKVVEAVAVRLERGLSTNAGPSAQSQVEEALQLALAVSNLPEIDPLQGAAELADRVTTQVRRWVYLRLAGAQTMEEVMAAATQVADLLVRLRALSGMAIQAHDELERELFTSAHQTPGRQTGLVGMGTEAHDELEREFFASVHQAIRRQVGVEVLKGLTLQDAAARVAQAREFVSYGLLQLLERLGRPERARSVVLLEVLALAEEHVARRERRDAMFRAARPLVGLIAAVLVVAAIVLLIFRPSIG